VLVRRLGVGSAPDRAAGERFNFVLRIGRVSASTAGWIAIAAAAVAGTGMIAWAWTLVLLRRARAAQRVLLGGRKQDLVDFAVSLQTRIDDVLRTVDEIAAGLSRVDRRVDGTVSRTSIVRYDALSDAGGHQSASLAMLDSSRTGVVISAIQGRDYARIYVKELDQGRAPVALSPEEREAVERAMAR
jgi:hypothetical protein